MGRPRIALLDASHNEVNTRRNFRREIDADLVEFDASSGQLPRAFDFDAVVVTGSRSSVYWDEPWIRSLKEWVAEAIDRDLPVLGVCYGHQLLAEVLGGTVEAMPDWEIGYHGITHNGTSRLFDGIDRDFVAFTTHSDEVTKLPAGATITAENEYAIHGFEHGLVFGVQFHPEYDMRTAAQITVEKDLPAERIDQVLDGITASAYADAQQAKRLFDNFLTIVADHRRTTEAVVS